MPARECVGAIIPALEELLHASAYALGDGQSSRLRVALFLPSAKGMARL
jgi:hypothetical protein